MNRTRHRGAWLLLCGLLALGAGLAQAHEDAPPPRPRHAGAAIPEGVQVPAWSELTPRQRERLAEFGPRWDRMPASRRAHLLERLQRRERWESMSPEQRERLREGARNFRDLSPELREKLRRSMRIVGELPEAERRALREQWHRMDPQQRRAWLEAGGPGVVPAPAE